MQTLPASRSPPELPGKPRLPRAHAGGVDRPGDRLDRCAYELLGHVVPSCTLARPLARFPPADTATVPPSAFRLHYAVRVKTGRVFWPSFTLLPGISVPYPSSPAFTCPVAITRHVWYAAALPNFAWKLK